MRLRRRIPNPESTDFIAPVFVAAAPGKHIPRRNSRTQLWTRLHTHPFHGTPAGKSEPNGPGLPRWLIRSTAEISPGPGRRRRSNHLKGLNSKKLREHKRSSQGRCCQVCFHRLRRPGCARPAGSKPLTTERRALRLQ